MIKIARSRRYGPARLPIACATVVSIGAGVICTAALQADVPDEQQKERVRNAVLGLAFDGDPDSNKDGVVDAADMIVFIPDSPAIHFSQPVSFWFQKPLGSITITENHLQEARPVSFWFQTDADSIVIEEHDLSGFLPVSFWFQTDPDSIVIEEHDAVQLGTPSFERQ